MELQKITKEALGQLKALGAEHSHVIGGETSFDELVYENDSFTLLRSVDEYSLSLTAIKNQKKGTYSLNQLESDEVKKACIKAIEIADAGKEDDAYGISSQGKEMKFEHGPQSADKEAMAELIKDFVAKTSKKFPQIGLRTVTVKYNKGHTFFINSNKDRAEAKKGYYTFSCLFNAQDGETSSSMNYDGLDFINFKQDLLSDEYFGKTFKDTIAHLKAEKLGLKLEGKAIFTPQCWQSFLSFILSHLSTGSLIGKTSRLQERIGDKVGSDLFHLESRPRDPLFANPNFLTADGIETENQIIFDKGILKTYLVDIYGKNKLSLNKVSNFATRLYMPKGQTSLDKMIEGIDEGILIGRFSGGYPSTNGDFSGIAKNSFYIKDGKIHSALSETMISGNIFDLIEKMYATSSEVYKNGTCHIPYVATEGVMIS